ncbi:hypothetical protein BGW80DRAFT_1285006 [Lactifluus volemus]|nr:hypothetical protein BGW80DRAFT_1285006 [Lactifluus volemus]
MPAPIQVAPSISRGMSWRKPVPVFIPTPPASRPTSGTSFIPASMLSGGDPDNCPTTGAPLDSPPPPVSRLYVILPASPG